MGGSVVPGRVPAYRGLVPPMPRPAGGCGGLVDAAADKPAPVAPGFPVNMAFEDLALSIQLAHQSQCPRICTRM